MTDSRVAYRKDGQLKHSSSCRMAFGRLDPENCARCATERAEGVPARIHEGFAALRRREANDARQLEGIRAHFATEKHRTGGCGVCCTYGDW